MNGEWTNNYAASECQCVEVDLSTRVAFIRMSVGRTSGRQRTCRDVIPVSDVGIQGAYGCVRTPCQEDT